MKRVLIISPYFPPSNTPDMQRVRMSLPSFAENGWEAEVVTADQSLTVAPKDEQLLRTFPESIKVHTVNAFSTKWTTKLGFGNIAYRSLWFFGRKGNALLAQRKFDLVYFSTTQFSVCTLGAYWNRKFDIPYVIDMQDPWHSDYYRDKPKNLQPPKYWFSYRLNKFLEPVAMRRVGGLISVSQQYITDLKTRYPQISNVPEAVIPFGSFEPDLSLAAERTDINIRLDPDRINIVYIGRGGADMQKAIQPLFEVLAAGLRDRSDTYSRLRVHFIGTSYAPAGTGTPSVLPLAEACGCGTVVTEQTDRISYFDSLALLMEADALFIPGSDDPRYTASKLYPYLLTKKPLLAVFNSQSPALITLKEYEAPYAFSYDKTSDLKEQISNFIAGLSEGRIRSQYYNEAALKKYSARSLTREQCILFDRVIGEGQ